MYREDPDGPQSDYALFKWSEALGSIPGNTNQVRANMQQFLAKYPQSALRAAATYLLAFTFLNNKPSRDDEAIKWMNQVVQEFPDSKEAPEALWHIGFFHAWNNRFKEAAAALEQLKAKYPYSPRHPHTQKWIDYLNYKAQNGGVWP